MRIATALVPAALASLVSGGSPGASVYTFGHGSSPSITDNVTPSTARLLLARRLGLSRFHNLENGDDLTLSILNRFSDSQSSLFGSSDDDEKVHRLLVIVEGVEDPGRIFAQVPTFTISNPPTPGANRQLLNDFLTQDNYRRGATGSRCIHSPGNPATSSQDSFDSCRIEDSVGKYDPKQELDLMKASAWRTQGTSADDRTSFLYISSLERIIAQEGLSSDRYQHYMSLLHDLLNNLVHQESMQESTVVLMPLASKQAKRSAETYSSYRVPPNTLRIREQQEEEPLSIYRPFTSPPAVHDSMPTYLHTTNSSSLPKVTMPICHSTEALCISTTQSCSGHGKCYTKNRDPTGEPSASDCWACGCTPSVVNVTDSKNKTIGIKTTNWGGPACQKKDVSAPFFLLAGFTIFIVATLSWGIGLLYSIGEEDLPSVIGAGVTGPRAQK
ncbi:hypothetical protein MMC17_003916 [Xylographa soralifera]|nr:hypothetical protein [Xylographa soralifera]